MATFTTASEESIENLQSFKAWTAPKIAKQSGEIAGLCEEVRQLRRMVVSNNCNCIVGYSYAASPVTPSFRPLGPGAHDPKSPSTVTKATSKGHDPSRPVRLVDEFENDSNGVERSSKRRMSSTPTHDHASTQLRDAGTEQQLFSHLLTTMTTMRKRTRHLLHLPVSDLAMSHTTSYPSMRAIDVYR